MSLLTISYDEVVIHETDDSCTLNTEGSYLEGDIEILVDTSGVLPDASGVEF